MKTFVPIRARVLYCLTDDFISTVQGRTPSAVRIRTWKKNEMHFLYPYLSVSIVFSFYVIFRNKYTDYSAIRIWPVRQQSRTINCQYVEQLDIGVETQSTLEGARHFCPKRYVWKEFKMPEFYMILGPPKNKIPEFHIITARKIFIPNFRGGRHVPPPAPRLLRLCCWIFCIVRFLIVYLNYSNAYLFR